MTVIDVVGGPHAGCGSYPLRGLKTPGRFDEEANSAKTNCYAGAVHHTGGRVLWGSTATQRLNAESGFT